MSFINSFIYLLFVLPEGFMFLFTNMERTLVCIWYCGTLWNLLIVEWFCLEVIQLLTRIMFLKEFIDIEGNWSSPLLSMRTSFQSSNTFFWVVSIFFSLTGLKIYVNNNTHSILYLVEKGIRQADKILILWKLAIFTKAKRTITSKTNLLKTSDGVQMLR